MTINPKPLSERMVRRVSAKLGIHRSVLRPVIKAFWEALFEEFVATGKADIPNMIKLSVGIRKGRWRHFAWCTPPDKWCRPAAYMIAKVRKPLKDRLYAQSEDETNPVWQTYLSLWNALQAHKEARIARRKAKREAWLAANPDRVKLPVVPSNSPPPGTIPLPAHTDT